jgi:hypothetical protein
MGRAIEYSQRCNPAGILGLMDRETDALLKMSLSMAVPLWIQEFKQKSWAEIQEIATEGSQFLGEHGDALMYKQKGTTAKAFNYLAKGIAALAFAPGGVNTFGMHFEAVHPESIKGKASRWFYHSTLADAVPRIADRGLTPDEGEIFFAETPAQAGQYEGSVFRERLESQGESWDPVLLRVNSAHMGDLQPDPHSFHDWFIARKIPWPFVQVWIPEKNAWIEIREVEKQGYLRQARTKYGKPGKIDVAPDAEPREYARRYIDQFWPKE